jgi:sugar phosphate isomerase/epimerase
MKLPRLAYCNFLSDVKQVKEFAQEYGFAGVDWSFTLEDMPCSPAAETALIKTLATLHPLEVRYHCAFDKTDLGDEDSGAAQKAGTVLRAVCRLVSRLKGRHLTMHVGLGRESTVDLCWESTLKRLVELAAYANRLGVRLCLENLAWGWSSRPELFEKLLRASGCWATFDIGHARVSPAVKSRLFEVADFVSPHPERFLNAHVYHEEMEAGHVAPERLADVADRLALLTALPLCR